VDRSRVERINRGEPPIFEPGLRELLAKHLADGSFRATLDAEVALADTRISMLAVGTPDLDGHIDLRYVVEAASTIGRHLRTRRDRHLVVVKSTVVPGSTVGPVREALENASGKQVGEGFGLAMNPEFLREGYAVSDFGDPDRIVLGVWDAWSGDVLEDLYQRFDCPKIRLSPTEAEFVKYTSNALLATLISFSNEIFGLCEATPGSSGRKVLECLHMDRRLTPLVNGRLVNPEILGYIMGGIGFGGSCLPKDLNAITTTARERGWHTPLLDAVVRVNKDRSKAVLARLERELGSMQDRTIAVLGLAFKPGTDDFRQSPSLPIVDALLESGCAVRVWDPLVEDHVEQRWGGRVKLYREAAPTLRGADAALVATAWPELKNWAWGDLVGTMATAVILDGRNVLGSVRWPERTRYVPVGDGPAYTSEEA
jgi:UDPglucose 6-dehydrogenase